MTAAGDALRRLVIDDARKRAASAASQIAGRLRTAAPPCLEWVHDEPSRPFPPHLALDTYAYETPDDPGLATSGAPRYAFVGPFFYIGDHGGCLCSETPVPREITVVLVEDGPNRITYRADTVLARSRMVSRPQPAGVLVGAGSAAFPTPPNPADAALDDPASRSTWWRDVVETWPDLLSR